MALKLEDIYRERAKENLSIGGQIGAEITNRGCQNSDKAIQPIDTKRELARIAHVSHDTIAKVKVIEQKALAYCASDAGRCALRADLRFVTDGKGRAGEIKSARADTGRAPGQRL